MNIFFQPPTNIESFGSVTGYFIGYKIFHSDKSFNFKPLESQTNEFKLTHLHKHTSYAITVQAHNSKGVGPQSTEVVVKTLDKDPPEPPILKIISTTSTSVVISWSIEDPTTVDGESIYY